MATKKTNINVSSLVTLEKEAINAVSAIGAGYANASKAILAYALGAKDAKASPALFEAGIVRIGNAVPGVAKITIGAYLSNARRIFAANAEAMDKAVKTAGTDSIKALAAACPAISKKGTGKKATSKKTSPQEVTAPIALPENVDAVQSVLNDLVLLRRIAAKKKNAKAILAIVGDVEDLISEVRSLMAA